MTLVYAQWLQSRRDRCEVFSTKLSSSSCVLVMDCSFGKYIVLHLVWVNCPFLLFTCLWWIIICKCRGSLKIPLVIVICIDVKMVPIDAASCLWVAPGIVWFLTVPWLTSIQFFDYTSSSPLIRIHGPMLLIGITLAEYSLVISRLIFLSIFVLNPWFLSQLIPPPRPLVRSWLLSLPHRSPRHPRPRLPSCKDKLLKFCVE